MRRKQAYLEFFPAPALPGLEVLRLQGGPSGRVGRHAHDSLILAAVSHGRRELLLTDAAHVAGPGDCYVLEPGRMHACRWSAGCRVDCLCIKDDLLKSLNIDCLWMLFDPVCKDAELYTAVRECAALAQEEGRGQDRKLRQLLRHAVGRVASLVSASGSMSGPIPEDAACGPVLAQLRQSLADLETEPPSCAELARAAGLSPWELSRAFARAFGAPPRDYRLFLRVQAAKKRLAQGQAPAYVALEMGFFDQSHLTRRFRGLVGLTPGRYAAALAPDAPERR
ncbi:MAG: AraC family transcriptional regulator [Desulfovibrionaceae bacterium]